MKIFAFIVSLLLSCSAFAGTYIITNAGEHTNDNSYSLNLNPLLSTNGPVTGRKVTIVEEYTSPANQVTIYNRTYENQSIAAFTNRPIGKYKYTSATSCFQFLNSPSWTNCNNSNLNLTINVVRRTGENLEAESNDGFFGVTYENTTDYGGGQNAASIHEGDFIEWVVSVEQTGFYSVISRSSATINARLDVLLNGNLKADIGISKTNGWQNWQDFESSSFAIPSGTHRIRVNFTTTDQNLNWIKLVPKNNISVAPLDSALWRIASRIDLKTLTRNGSSFSYSDYSAAADQHWRFVARGDGSYDVKMESNQQCLSVSGSNAILSTCNTPQTKWNVDVIRERTEDHPAIYFLRNNQGTCLSQSFSGGNAVVSIANCNRLSRWYIEPVGFDERSFPQEYEIKSLLIVKPETNVPNLTVGTLSPSLIDVVRNSYEINMPTYFTSMTDGRVKFVGDTVVSNEPIRSLSIIGGCPGWNIPMPQNIPNDIQRHVQQGKYDEVQVFFNSGSVNGGGGCGPGRSISSNHSMWTTVNGHNSELSAWLDPLQVRSKTEIFIHEPMHGYDDYHGVYGLAVPDGGLHSAEEYFYMDGSVGWMHWYRDYWLGTVIGGDDTYRGYGPKMFRLPTVRQAAASKPATAVKVTHESSGKCFIPQSGSANPVNGEAIVLTSNCNTSASSFILESNGMLKHKSSGKCIHPQYGYANNNTFLVLDNSCTYEYRLEHELTNNGSLMNVQYGRCVHPNGGSSNPAEGTQVLYHDGCDENRLLFKLIRH